MHSCSVKHQVVTVHVMEDDASLILKLSARQK